MDILQLRRYQVGNTSSRKNTEVKHLDGWPLTILVLQWILKLKSTLNSLERRNGAGPPFFKLLFKNNSERAIFTEMYFSRIKCNFITFIFYFILFVIFPCPLQSVYYKSVEQMHTFSLWFWHFEYILFFLYLKKIFNKFSKKIKRNRSMFFI